MRSCTCAVRCKPGVAVPHGGGWSAPPHGFDFHLYVYRSGTVRNHFNMHTVTHSNHVAISVICISQVRSLPGGRFWRAMVGVLRMITSSSCISAGHQQGCKRPCASRAASNLGPVDATEASSTHVAALLYRRAFR